MSSTPGNPTFRLSDREKLGAQPYGCDFHMHGPPDWQDSMGSMSSEEYIETEYLPRILATGRQVIGVPQHGPTAQNGAKAIRDIARRLRASGNMAIPVVFPGYELTSSDQLQVILLADPDEQDLRDLDTRVHESLQLGAGRWHESGLTLVEMLEVVRDRFRDRLITLAVATGHKGLLEDRDFATRNREAFRQAMGLADGMTPHQPCAAADRAAGGAAVEAVPGAARGAGRPLTIPAGHDFHYHREVEGEPTWLTASGRAS